MAHIASDFFGIVAAVAVECNSSSRECSCSVGMNRLELWDSHCPVSMVVHMTIELETDHAEWHYHPGWLD